jgi:hypothetical protein
MTKPIIGDPVPKWAYAKPRNRSSNQRPKCRGQYIFIKGKRRRRAVVAVGGHLYPGHGPAHVRFRYQDQNYRRHLNPYLSEPE